MILINKVNIYNFDSDKDKSKKLDLSEINYNIVGFQGAKICVFVDWPSVDKENKEYETLTNVFSKLNTKIEHIAIINKRDQKALQYQEIKALFPFHIFIISGKNIEIEGLPIKLAFNKIVEHEMNFFLHIPSMYELVHSQDNLLKETAWESIKSIFYKSK